jgi:hypothetical protein
MRYILRKKLVGKNMRLTVSGLVLAIICFTGTAHAQDGYFSDWFSRVDQTKDEQPHWVTPIATTTPRLEEEYRYDQVWQTNAKGLTTNNYDGGKGLELIPFEKVEVIFNIPPYINHNNPDDRNGWGDAAFLVKYRLLSANENHGNYILTAFLGWSLPTGQFSNGALHAVITPTIAYGKGFGNFDAQGTFGIALPVADTNLIGRSFLFNNTLQYRLLRKLWPEVEFNSTIFQDGKNDGMKQNFVTPGLVMGRFRLLGRMGFTVGAGYQIATTHFHTSNHDAILSVRFPF